MESFDLSKLDPRDLKDIFKALSNETRLRIILLLDREKREMNVREIAIKLGITDSLACHNLKILERSSLLVERKNGRVTLYRDTLLARRVLNSARVEIRQGPFIPKEIENDSAKRPSLTTT